MTKRPSRAALPSLSCACVLAATVSASAQNVTLPAAADHEDAGSRAPVSSTVLSSLFEETVRDLRRVTSKDTLTWLGLGAMAAGFSHSFDRSVSDGLSGAHGLDATFEPGKTIGGARLQLLGAVSTLAVGELARSNTTARIGADLVKAQILTQAVTAGLKMSVRRTRPDGTQFSFPSGHTSTTFATAAVLQRHLGWKAGVPAYALAAYVATSRIQEKRHFLSDVTFGAAIGIVVGRAVGVGRDEARFAIAPLTAPGGGGVAFTWIGR